MKQVHHTLMIMIFFCLLVFNAKSQSAPSADTTFSISPKEFLQISDRAAHVDAGLSRVNTKALNRLTKQQKELS